MEIVLCQKGQKKKKEHLQSQGTFPFSFSLKQSCMHTDYLDN